MALRDPNRAPVSREAPTRPNHPMKNDEKLEKEVLEAFSQHIWNTKDWENGYPHLLCVICGRFKSLTYVDTDPNRCFTLSKEYQTPGAAGWDGKPYEELKHYREWKRDNP